MLKLIDKAMVHFHIRVFLMIPHSILALIDKLPSGGCWVVEHRAGSGCGSRLIWNSIPAPAMFGSGSAKGLPAAGGGYPLIGQLSFGCVTNESRDSQQLILPLFLVVWEELPRVLIHCGLGFLNHQGTHCRQVRLGQDFLW